MHDTGWFKSSYSGGADDNCVEVRITDDTTHIRDTKNRAAGTLQVPVPGWAGFISTLA